MPNDPAGVTFHPLQRKSRITHCLELSQVWQLQEHQAHDDIHMSTGLRACLNARQVQNSMKAIVKLLLLSS